MSELQALLRVQQDDDLIRAIDARRDALGPRVIALDKARLRAIDDAGRNEAALDRELERLHALEANIVDHKQRHEKNLGVLNQAHKLKEATAAMAQVEAARRVLADEESELLGLARRIADLRALAVSSREAAVVVEAAQGAERAAIAADRESIDAELAHARSRRAESSKTVSATMLSRYDRVLARRKSAVVFPLGSGFSCGSCDTAMAMQRRPAMASGTLIEMCEGCGVLLYMPIATTTER